MSRTLCLLALLIGLAVLRPLPSQAYFKEISAAPAAHDIIWGPQITLNPPGRAMGRYPRLVVVRKGAHQGDLLLSYQTGSDGGDFMMYRSSDQGRTWAPPVMVNQATTEWDYASCNIIQLSDGRLMMTMQRRARGTNLGKDFYIDIKFSSDGGDTWGPPQQVFQGANWEGRAIEVPHDANGDGIPDIYLFYTQRVIDTHLPAATASRHNDHGRAVAFVASYDGGKTWVDPNPERFTGHIVHRDYREGPHFDPTDASGGGMPQPFLLPNDRVAFVAEELSKQDSPLVIANDPGDWDWTGPKFQGPWTSADYDGSADNNVYPKSPDNVWVAEKYEFSKAPYAAVLPDGRIAMASQSPFVVRVWVGDKTAHDFQPQELPFGKNTAVWPFIEPISPTEVMVGGGSNQPGDNFIYLRIGKIAP